MKILCTFISDTLVSTQCDLDIQPELCGFEPLIFNLLASTGLAFTQQLNVTDSLMSIWASCNLLFSTLTEQTDRRSAGNFIGLSVCLQEGTYPQYVSNP